MIHIFCCFPILSLKEWALNNWLTIATIIIASGFSVWQIWRGIQEQRKQLLANQRYEMLIHLHELRIHYFVWISITNPEMQQSYELGALEELKQRVRQMTYLIMRPTIMPYEERLQIWRAVGSMQYDNPADRHNNLIDVISDLERKLNPDITKVLMTVANENAEIQRQKETAKNHNQ